MAHRESVELHPALPHALPYWSHSKAVSPWSTTEAESSSWGCSVCFTLKSKPKQATTPQPPPPPPPSAPPTTTTAAAKATKTAAAATINLLKDEPVKPKGKYPLRLIGPVSSLYLQIWSSVGVQEVFCAIVGPCRYWMFGVWLILDVVTTISSLWSLLYKKRVLDEEYFPKNSSGAKLQVELGIASLSSFCWGLLGKENKTFHW